MSCKRTPLSITSPPHAADFEISSTKAAPCRITAKGHVARCISSAAKPDPSRHGAGFCDLCGDSPSKSGASTPSAASEARPKRAGRSVKQALVTAGSKFGSATISRRFPSSVARERSECRTFAHVLRGMACRCSFITRHLCSECVFTKAPRSSGVSASAATKSIKAASTFSPDDFGCESMVMCKAMQWSSKSMARRVVLRAIWASTLAAASLKSSSLECESTCTK
mmetsp:Transcript_29206/g.100826  ORF Transcript_29206/g.100826 Transcript_29206/m.100826 type:complete len:225 (-) Transcript_29206:542-1216(-)